MDTSCYEPPYQIHIGTLAYCVSLCSNLLDNTGPLSLNALSSGVAMRIFSMHSVAPFQSSIADAPSSMHS